VTLSPDAGDGGLGVVVVTGGSSGLGAAVAAAVTAEGGTAVVLDLHPPADAATDFEQVDLADGRAAEAAVERVATRHGQIDGVVTAAGTDSCGRLGDVAASDWERVVAVNLMGTAAVARAALPHLERSGGRLVTVGSTLGVSAVSDATAYCASKFGVTGFTRALAAETAGRVGVSLLIPGGMSTAFFDSREERYKPPPDARLNAPENVAAAAIFALRQPPGCELRELVVCPSTESSWPP
jgi:NAD(P)-dependent dehydrogenase (short-subunit alcohol dehydrogenase family)